MKSPDEERHSFSRAASEMRTCIQRALHFACTFGRLFQRSVSATVGSNGFFFFANNRLCSSHGKFGLHVPGFPRTERETKSRTQFALAQFNAAPLAIVAAQVLPAAVTTHCISYDIECPDDGNGNKTPAAGLPIGHPDRLTNNGTLQPRAYFYNLIAAALLIAGYQRLQKSMWQKQCLRAVAINDAIMNFLASPP